MEEKERYWGSVRFFRHLILSSTAAMIVIPVTLCIVLAVGNRKLNKKNENLTSVNEELENELDRVDAMFPEYQRPSIGRASAEEVLHQAEEDGEEWALTLVNDSHPIDESYYVELVSVTGGQKVDIRIEEALTEMIEDMKAEGMRPLVCSGYRDIKRQTELFDEYIEDRLKQGWNFETAFYKAKSRIALPGTSEHHTGLAVDIVGMDYQSLDEGQAETKEARWLEAHSWEYGFILRYPKGKTDITGIEYESWHFRYVGKRAAASIADNKLTLEEYLGRETVDK